MHRSARPSRNTLYTRRDSGSLCIHQLIMKKKKYIAPKVNEDELKEFKEHSKIINEKMKAISAKYRKWWDKDKGQWKKGFDEKG